MSRFLKQIQSSNKSSGPSSRWARVWSWCKRLHQSFALPTCRETASLALTGPARLLRLSQIAIRGGALPAMLSILSIAVLGRHGNPLFLESYSSRRGGQADLKWHYAANTALDFFEERGTPKSARHDACADQLARRTASGQDDRVLSGHALCDGGLCCVRACRKRFAKPV